MYACVSVCMYAFIQPLNISKMRDKVIFKVWIQSFPYHRLVTIPGFKSQVVPIIQPEGKLFDADLSEMYKRYVKYKQLHPGFWIWLAVSISYDDNRYTANTFIYIYNIIYIYIYIYIILSSTDRHCFVLSELFSMARQARFPKLGTKPGWLKRQSKSLATRKPAQAKEI